MARGMVSALVLSAIVLIQVDVAVSVTNEGLTDAEFLTILKGRCVDYTEVLRKTLTLPRANCTELTTSFENIFKASGAACISSSYEPFVKKFHHTVPKDKGLLWSGVYEIQKLVAMDGERFYPIRLTLIGYVLDMFSWCETNVFKNKKGCQNCSTRAAIDAFWEKASEYFARSLSGKVRIILSSRENGVAFSSKSILYRIEIPNLPKTVTSVEVWPVRKLSVSSGAKTERCGEGTLKTMKTAVEKQLGNGRAFSCYNNEKLPIFAMCLMKPERCVMPYTGGFMTAPSLWTVILLTVGYFLQRPSSLC